MVLVSYNSHAIPLLCISYARILNRRTNLTMNERTQTHDECACTRVDTRNTYNPQIIKIESEKTLWKQQQQQVHLHQLVVVEENNVTSTLVEIILLEQKQKLRN